MDNAVTNALAAYPNVQVQTRAQFEQAQVASVNQLLGLVYALLALAVLIALIGIVNTLMLSVFERTREIGLLRAVGMKRRQVRTMIRSEAVILAIFGAIIGIIIGTGMGIALVSSLKQQGITDTVVPVSSLVSSWSWPPCSAWSPRAGPPAGRRSWTCWPPSPLNEASPWFSQRLRPQTALTAVTLPIWKLTYAATRWPAGGRSGRT